MGFFEDIVKGIQSFARIPIVDQIGKTIQRAVYSLPVVGSVVQGVAEAILPPAPPSMPPEQPSPFEDLQYDVYESGSDYSSDLDYGDEGGYY